MFNQHLGVSENGEKTTQMDPKMAHGQRNNDDNSGATLFPDKPI